MFVHIALSQGTDEHIVALRVDPGEKGGVFMQALGFSLGCEDKSGDHCRFEQVDYAIVIGQFWPAGAHFSHELHELVERNLSVAVYAYGSRPVFFGQLV